MEWFAKHLDRDSDTEEDDNDFAPVDSGGSDIDISEDDNPAENEPHPSLEDNDDDSVDIDTPTRRKKTRRRSTIRSIEVEKFPEKRSKPETHHHITPPVSNESSPQWPHKNMSEEEILQIFLPRHQFPHPTPKKPNENQYNLPRALELMRVRVKKPVSIYQSTRDAWEEHKNKENLNEELKVARDAGQGKVAGFLSKRTFINKSEEKQYEIAKALRAEERRKRDLREGRSD
ncbi:hypothetical protein BLNAU_19213 [Blattamonas nauphoetae]|uniref:BCNT-C domain-containing protein n=1 Tax=Blattamonas nauphoetae TaxID=2049346 RepID=A0ABQ9X236_9EUKA|nr:hypothetical protein BLNAU_19213 [Blattamonas nauphoetae]